MTALLAALLAAQPVTDDLWLTAWVGGKDAPPALMTEFHRQFAATSPHAADSLEYEAATRARAVAAGDAKRSARVRAAAEASLASPKTAPHTAARAAQVLGWLQQPESVPALEKAAAATASPPEVRRAAIGALRFFGARPTHDAFIVYGGRLARVDLPPKPDERATVALAAATRDRDERVREAAFRALEPHDGAVVEVALRAAVDEGRDGEAVARALTQRSLEGRAALLARYADSKDAVSRAEAAAALGKLGAKEQQPVLVRLLDDPDDRVFAAALGALRALHGLPGETSRASAEDRALLTSLWKKRLGVK